MDNLKKADWYAVGCFVLAGMFSAFMDTRQWADPNILRTFFGSLGWTAWYAPVDAHVWKQFVSFPLTCWIASGLGWASYVFASERKLLFAVLAVLFVFYVNYWAIWDF